MVAVKWRAIIVLKGVDITFPTLKNMFGTDKIPKKPHMHCYPKGSYLGSPVCVLTPQNN